MKPKTDSPVLTGLDRLITPPSARDMFQLCETGTQSVLAVLPIEEAPKDGTKFLVFMDYEPCFCFYDFKEKNQTPKPFFNYGHRYGQRYMRENPPLVFFPIPDLGSLLAKRAAYAAELVALAERLPWQQAKRPTPPPTPKPKDD